MKTRTLLLSLAFLTAPASVMWAADPSPLKDLLRDGLYQEEVNRDREAAAKTYEQVLARNDEDRAFAATALFRLAEVRRKQGRKDDAIAAYRTLLIRYPEAETECKLAQENLAGLGAPDLHIAPGGTSPSAEAVDESGHKLTATELLQRADRDYLATLQAIAEKSPDKLGEKENFQKVISSGYTESLAFLLQKATPTEQTPVLIMAVDAGSLEAVKQIFQAKTPLSASQKAEALTTAAGLNQFYIAQELLNQGVDVNGLAGHSFSGKLPENPPDLSRRPYVYWPGSALTTAIAYRSPKLVELLLKANADVNVLPDPQGSTALDMALQAKDVDLVKDLLARGANPNLLVKGPNPGDEIWSSLDFALAGNVSECVPLLVKAGGKLQNWYRLLDSNSKPEKELNHEIETLLNLGMDANSLPELERLLSIATAEQAKMLLSHGLDPNHVDKGGYSLLMLSIFNKRFDLARLLLDAGAKVAEPPDNGGRQPALLLTAASTGAPVGLLEILIAKGCTLDKDWDRSRRQNVPGSPNNYYNGTPEVAPGVRSLFFRRFKLPALPESEDIRVVYHQESDTMETVIQEKSPSPQPPSLERILVGPRVPIAWTAFPNKLGPEKITIWRTGAEGEPRTALEADIRQDAAFPALQWGDVIELTYRPEDEDAPDKNISMEQQARLPDQATWKMRQRIAFPITVEIDGKTQELTMRGDRVIFDPTSKEVPLMGSAQLASLFCGLAPGLQQPVSVAVIRAGWPDIGVSLQSKFDTDFTLAPGDRLKCAMTPVNSTPQSRNDIALYSPGLPFRVVFPVDSSGADRSSPAIPTLLQALAIAYAPAQHDLKSVPSSNPEEIDAWLAGGFGSRILSVLPHPDLAHIRIHRKSGEGEPAIIEVDLQKSIDALSQPNAASAKSADIALERGDQVELSILTDKPGQPWTGFTPSQTSFLEQALSCSLPYKVEDKALGIFNLIYHPPRFTSTPGGLVPLPSPQGVSSPLASEAFGPDSISAVGMNGETPYGYPADRVYLSDRFQYFLYNEPSQVVSNVSSSSAPSPRRVRIPRPNQEPQPGSLVSPHR